MVGAASIHVKRTRARSITHQLTAISGSCDTLPRTPHLRQPSEHCACWRQDRITHGMLRTWNQTTQRHSISAASAATRVEQRRSAAQATDVVEAQSTNAMCHAVAATTTAPPVAMTHTCVRAFVCVSQCVRRQRAMRVPTAPWAVRARTELHPEHKSEEHASHADPKNHASQRETMVHSRHKGRTAAQPCSSSMGQACRRCMRHVMLHPASSLSTRHQVHCVVALAAAALPHIAAPSLMPARCVRL